MNDLRIVPVTRGVLCVVVLATAIMVASELFAAGVVHKRLQQNEAMRNAGGGAVQMDPALADAVNKVQEAIRLAQQASALIKESPSQENIKTAEDLFTQAGKRFEYAEGVFISFPEEVVSDEDLNGCESAKNQCYESAEKCRSSLQQQAGDAV